MSKPDRVDKPLRPPFCRIGSKRDIADMVIDYFPEDFKTYVEPFIGSGAIFWKKTPSEVEVINDLDSKLANDYKLLQKTDTRSFPQDLDTVGKIQKFVDRSPQNDGEKLAFGIVNRCNHWMGKETGYIYSDSNPYNKLKNIDLYQERLRGVKIHNESYEKVIKKYDSPSTFFYLDPPYEETKSTGKLYEHGGMNFDFLKMRETLDKVKGKWLLSINDSPNIRQIFKGYYYKAFTVKAKSNFRDKKGKSSIGGKDRKELLIANYGEGGKL